MTTKCPQAIDILWKLNATEVGVTIQEFESMKPFPLIPTDVVWSEIPCLYCFIWFFFRLASMLPFPVTFYTTSSC